MRPVGRPWVQAAVILANGLSLVGLGLALFSLQSQFRDPLSERIFTAGLVFLLVVALPVNYFAIKRKPGTRRRSPLRTAIGLLGIAGGAGLILSQLLVVTFSVDELGLKFDPLDTLEVMQKGLGPLFSPLNITTVLLAGYVACMAGILALRGYPTWVPVLTFVSLILSVAYPIIRLGSPDRLRAPWFEFQNESNIAWTLWGLTRPFGLSWWLLVAVLIGSIALLIPSPLSKRVT